MRTPQTLLALKSMRYRYFSVRCRTIFRMCHARGATLAARNSKGHNPLETPTPAGAVPKAVSQQPHTTLTATPVPQSEMDIQHTSICPLSLALARVAPLCDGLAAEVVHQHAVVSPV